MKQKDFNTIAQEKFNFLVSEFHFKMKQIPRNKNKNLLLYSNTTTGVEIAYEFRYATVNIMLYRLVESKFIRNPINITKGTKLFGFDLIDLLSIRNPNAIILPAYEYGENSKYYNPIDGFELYIGDFAAILKNNAADVLLGDFTIFTELENIVKGRI